VQTPTDRILALYKSDTYIENMVESFKYINPINETNSTGDPINDLTQLMVEGMNLMNKPYLSRLDKSRGAFYTEDWFLHNEKSNSIQSGICGRANLNYWRVDLKRTPFFVAKDNVTATDALGSFLAGPTIMDCGSALSASINYGLLKFLGSEKFNYVFGNKNLPFNNLIITNLLYQKMEVVNKNRSEYSDPLYMIGNPLYSLFDLIVIEKNNIIYKLDDLQNGDIVHIKGVKDYEYKHLSGAGRGWNLICVKSDGNESENKTMFSGFWPGKGQVLLTYIEVKNMLIDSYNKNHDSVTVEHLEKNKEKINKMIFNESPSEILERVKIDTTHMLKDDVKTYDDPIVGITCVIRFNKSKLIDLLIYPAPIMNQQLWHNKDINVKDIFDLEKDNTSTKLKTSLHTVENKYSTFKSYEIKEDVHKTLFNAFIKLTSYLINTTKSQRKFVGLSVTGCAGLGKTHLSIATSKLCISEGIKVFIIDSKTVGEMFQESGGIMPNYFSKITNADLLIMDDINSKYATGYTILKQMIEFAINNKKAIIITSNHSDIGYYKLLDPMTYDNESSLGFIAHHNLIGNSYRQGWSNSTTVFDKADILEGLELLYMFNQTESAIGKGIIINGYDFIDDDIVNTVKNHILGINPKSKIYLPGSPYIVKVHDMYMHKLKKDSAYDTVIISIDKKNGRTEQLINLISKVHDYGLKVIVLVDKSIDLNNQIKQELKKITKKDNEIRLIDRTKSLFPSLL
jgi:DNA replication protein DnaC